MNGYGITGTTWKRPGLFMAIVIVIGSWCVAPVVLGPAAGIALWIADAFGALTPSVGNTIGAAAMLVGAIGGPVLGFRLYRRVTTRPAWWCDRCGVRTDPTFDICRSCGRVKRTSHLPAR